MRSAGSRVSLRLKRASISTGVGAKRLSVPTDVDDGKFGGAAAKSVSSTEVSGDGTFAPVIDPEGTLVTTGAPDVDKLVDASWSEVIAFAGETVMAVEGVNTDAGSCAPEAYIVLSIESKFS